MAITIPTDTVPDVEPNYPRPAYADYGAGAGRALEGLGQAVTAGANELSQRVFQLQEQQDAVVAQQKVMAAQQAVTDKLYGDGGIASATGIQAQGMTQRTKDLLNTTLQEALKDTTPRQQQMIQGMWGRFSIGRIESTAQRELLIHQQTVKETAQAGIEMSATIASQDPANLRSVQAEADAAADKWQAANAGASPDVITNGRAHASSYILKQAILARAETDPMGAATMFQAYGPRLVAEDLLTTQNRLRPLVQKAQVDAFSQSLGTGPADVSPEAVKARIPQVESGGRQMDPRTGGPVTSPKGAVGMWQVEPDTARATAAAHGIPWDENRFRTDAGYNGQIGSAYFDDMAARYSGNTLLAAAAYNAGPGNVDNWLKTIGDPRTGAVTPQDFASRIPVKETRDYVHAVGAVPASSPRADFFVVGDSLGYGLQTAGGLPGTAKEKASPFDVYEQIKATPDDQVRGKTVLLSSGYSNNPEAIGLVDQQIAALKAKGAAEVRLVGVGDRADLAGGNEALAAAASRGGAKFLGPVSAGADHVHPADYKPLLNVAQQDGPASAVRPPAPPNLDDWIQQAHAASHGDPDLDQRMVAAAQQKYTRWEAQTHVARADLDRSLPDIQKALEAGVDVQIPELQIRSLLPPPQADRIMAELNVSQAAGQAFKSIDLASPDQLNATIKDLSSGMGSLSQMIRVRGKTLSGPGMIADSGDGSQPGTPSLAGEVSAAPGESATQFGLRKQVLNRFLSLVATRTQALKDDPAAYVAARDPVVSDRLKALQAAPNDAGAQQAYEDALVAEQQRLGVQTPRLLSNGQVAQQVKLLTQTDPAQGNVTVELDKMAAQFGDRWPQAFGELVKVGKLNPQYQTLATMTEPSQEIARDDFQRALGMISEDKGGFKRLVENAPQQTTTAINDAIDAATDEFRQTTQFKSGGMDLLENVRQSIKTLAYYYAMRDGIAGDQAVTQATDAILNQKYDFNGTMRVPKGKLADVTAASNALKSSLKPEDLVPLESLEPGLTLEARRRITLAAAQNGVWVPNEDDTGLELLGVLKKNGAHVPLRRADQSASGTPVSLSFQNLPAWSAPAPVLAPEAIQP